MRARVARRVVAGLVTLAIVLTAAACGAAGERSEDSPDGPFVVARTAGVSLLDPARASDPYTVHTLDLVYDTLLDTTDGGELVPGLATGWEVGADGRTVTFKLRRGVTFHHGAAFTAADARATLQRARRVGARSHSVVGSHLRNVENIETPGPYRLVLRLRRPDAALLTALTYVGASMLDAGDIRAGTVTRRPNGTGPFRWVSWKQGAGREGSKSRVTLAANPGYWDGAPKLSRLVLRVVPDEGAIRSGVAAGEFQLGVVSDPGVVRNVDRGVVRVLEQPTLSPYVLVLSRTRGPLRDPRVRRAIACAVDRKQLSEVAYSGYGVLTGPITSPAYSYPPTAALPCDPPDRRRAARLLAAAGYPSGFVLDAVVTSGEGVAATSADPEAVRNIAQSLREQLRQIGVRLKLERRRVDLTGDSGPAGGVDAAVTTVSGSYDPYLMYARYFPGGSAAAPPGEFPRLATLLDRANSTTDTTTRRRIFAALQREMLQRSPWVWLLRDSTFYLAGEDVRGFEPTPNGSLKHLRSARRVDADSA